MMPGRCAGCGETSKDVPAVREHVRYCPGYQRLHAEHPERALEPEQEFARYVREQRADDRAGRREAVIAEADRRRAEQASRWRTPADILEEDV